MPIKKDEQTAITKPKRSGNRGRNSPVIGDNGLSVKPGDNAKYAGLILEVCKWEPIDKTDVDALEKRLLQYLNFCISNDVKVGNQGCYFALGLTKDDVYNWEHGNTRTSAHSDFIKKIKKICAYNREFLMQDGKLNPITGIFWQKNYDGLRDQQDIVLSPHNPLGDMVDQKQLQERYASAVDDLDE